MLVRVETVPRMPENRGEGKKGDYRMDVLVDNIWVVAAVAALVAVAAVVLVLVLRSRARRGHRDPLMWSDFVVDHDRKKRRR